jgi:hypothetical protein
MGWAEELKKLLKIPKTLKYILGFLNIANIGI